MCDYQNAKVYKIVDPNEEMVYIGSTTQALSKRFAAHRSTHKKLTGGKCTVSSIFNTYGIENCKILLIENFPCNNKEELIKKEAEYIKTINCVNKVIPNRTKKEYNKKYNEDNKESIAAYQKEYNEANKDSILTKAKEYYVDNKEALLAKQKEYYEANKESIVAKRKARYEAKKALDLSVN